MTPARKTAARSASRTPTAPDRGDVVWLEFDPSAGHEQAGRRPALVLSPRAYNQTIGLALVCPITSKAKGYPFEVPFPPTGQVKGVVLADHVKSLDWEARKAEAFTTAPAAVVTRVLDLLRKLL